MIAPAFRFEPVDHSYYLDDHKIPSITQLIERGGLLGPGADYYTESSRDRGHEVHRLCADYDLGALDLPRLESPHRGYVLAYIAASQALKPSWTEIEEADAHPKYRFAGRIDRAGVVLGRQTVAELKSAAKAKHHQIQTALQAILKSARHGLPAESWQRLVIYLKNTGKYSVEIHEDLRDFAEAYRLIREFCQ